MVRGIVSALGVLLCSSCAHPLGLDKAELDPTFDESVSKGGSQARGGVCKTFDNKRRLTKLMADGSLAPLPQKADSK
jgi:hypothetical protein